MILLTLICALISAAVVGAAVLWHRFAPAQGALAHEKALYAGFVADVDRRLSVGELDADAAHEEKVEAARALLKAGEPSATGEIRPVFGIMAIVAAAALAFGVYMVVGHPGMPDQPYQERLARWTRMAQEDTRSVPPEVMAAVLHQGEADLGGNADYWVMVGEANLMAGDNYSSMKAYQRARALSPQTFAEWSALGEAMTLTSGGASNAQAVNAFEEALKLDPRDARALYYVARHQVATGEFDAARASFRLALASTAPDHPWRPGIETELRGVDIAEKSATAARTGIAGMVASLAASLKADPDNPDGWARLLRSYDVLGDTVAHDRAVADMQAHYRDRPEVVQAILAKSKQAVGAEAVQ